MDITPDLPSLNIYNLFNNERIRIYLCKHNRMSLNTMDYFVKQISHLSKGVVIVADVNCCILTTMLLESLLLSNRDHLLPSSLAYLPYTQCNAPFGNFSKLHPCQAYILFVIVISLSQTGSMLAFVFSGSDDDHGLNPFDLKRQCVLII